MEDKSNTPKCFSPLHIMVNGICRPCLNGNVPNEDQTECSESPFKNPEEDSPKSTWAPKIDLSKPEKCL